MKASDLSEALFTRVYEYDGGNLVVRIWPPVESDGGTLCQFQIEGVNKDAVHRAVGMDRLDALYNAMLTIGLLLHDFREAHPGLKWSGAVYRDELGVPHPYKAPFDEKSGEWAVEPPSRQKT